MLGGEKDVEMCLPQTDHLDALTMSTCTMEPMSPGSGFNSTCTRQRLSAQVFCDCDAGPCASSSGDSSGVPRPAAFPSAFADPGYVEAAKHLPPVAAVV